MFPEDTNDTFDEIVRNADLDARLARLSARADRTRPATTTGAPAPAKRRSAARGSRRTALGLSAVTSLGLAGWMYSAAGTTSTNLASIASTTDATTATSVATQATVATGAATTSATTSATTATTASTATATATSTGSTLKDGTWTGTSTSTRFGPVQVQITVSGGKITAVNVLNYPKSDNRSASINASAVPKLVTATLTAQNANVSNVSGATYTTTGYKASLQSAIDAARAAA